MVKPRMGVILRESVSVSGSGSKSRCFGRPEEFKALKEKYGSFLKRLDDLIRALQKQKELMILLDQAKSNVAEKFVELAKKSPVSAPAGSYSYIHEKVLEKTCFKAEKLEHFAIDYVSKWKRVLQQRIAADSKATEKKRVDMEHYQRKVNSLQLTMEKLLSKAQESNKPVPQAAQEKLARNLDKLNQAKQAYRQAWQDLCNLMEECTDRGWRDLYPLLLKCAQFDMFSASDDANILGSLKGVVSDLQTLSATHGACAQPRLDQFASAAAESISTKPKLSFFEDDEQQSKVIEGFEQECAPAAAANDPATERVEEITEKEHRVIEPVKTYDESDDEVYLSQPQSVQEKQPFGVSNVDDQEDNYKVAEDITNKVEADVNPPVTANGKEDESATPETSHLPDALPALSFSTEDEQVDEIVAGPPETAGNAVNDEGTEVEPVRIEKDPKEQAISDLYVDQEADEQQSRAERESNEDDEVDLNKTKTQHADKTDEPFLESKLSETQENAGTDEEIEVEPLNTEKYAKEQVGSNRYVDQAEGEQQRKPGQESVQDDAIAKDVLSKQESFPERNLSEVQENTATTDEGLDVEPAKTEKDTKEQFESHLHVDREVDEQQHETEKEALRDDKISKEDPSKEEAQDADKVDPEAKLSEAQEKAHPTFLWEAPKSARLFL